MAEPSGRTAWEIFREWEGPLGERLRLAATNQWSKVRRRRPCCGNPGEPGC